MVVGQKVQLDPAGPVLSGEADQCLCGVSGMPRAEAGEGA